MVNIFQKQRGRWTDEHFRVASGPRTLPAHTGPSEVTISLFS